MAWLSRLVALAGALLVSGQVAADNHWLQPDFTFKRIGVPQAGQARRITVQVPPSAPSGPSAPPRAGEGGGAQIASAPRSTPKAALDWFWTDISPDRDASGPGRLAAALTHLGNAPAGKGAPEPRLALLQEIAQSHGLDILRTTVGTRVSPALVMAVIAVESAGRADAVSGAGAEGLMQLMPATAERFGVTDSLDPADNIMGGVSYLSWLMEEFGEDPILYLAAYNAGEGSIRDHAGVPPYAETRDYVPKVLAAWKVARALCKTPPELMTDGCVFSVSGN